MAVAQDVTAAAHPFVLTRAFEPVVFRLAVLLPFGHDPIVLGLGVGRLDDGFAHRGVGAGCQAHIELLAQRHPHLNGFVQVFQHQPGDVQVVLVVAVDRCLLLVVQRRPWLDR